MFTDKSVKKTKGREIPNLKDIKNKIKLGVDDYLKSINIIFSLSSCANKKFLTQRWRKACVGLNSE